MASVVMVPMAASGITNCRWHQSAANCGRASGPVPRMTGRFAGDLGSLGENMKHAGVVGHFVGLRNAAEDVGHERKRVSFALPGAGGSQRQSGMVYAAWTRRSKGPLEPPKGKKSWKQRHEKFLKPFILDVFISHKYVHAKVVHRLTSRVVSVATTNAKDLRLSLYSLNDDSACKTIGKLLAERSIEADVFAVTFSLRKNERFEGRLALVVNTMVENGVALV